MLSFLLAVGYWLAGSGAPVSNNCTPGDNTKPIGWHIARVRFFGVSASWKKVCPTANFLLRYTKKETYSAMTEGQEEARELSASNYGRDEWWVLLEPVATDGS